MYANNLIVASTKRDEEQEREREGEKVMNYDWQAAERERAKYEVRSVRELQAQVHLE